MCALAFRALYQGNKFNGLSSRVGKSVQFKSSKLNNLHAIVRIEIFNMIFNPYPYCLLGARIVEL